MLQTNELASIGFYLLWFRTVLLPSCLALVLVLIPAPLPASVILKSLFTPQSKTAVLTV